MIILPSIDIKDGKCVRLKGRLQHSTRGFRSAQLTAEAFKQAGATLIHVVDLDAAKATAAITEA